MATRMQQRRGTATMWTNANPILGVAEIGYETDTNKFKIGDGTNRWADLSYFVDLDTMIEGAPGLLNSLDEIAAAIGDDPAFFTTIATGLATKAPLASPTFTGTVSGVTKAHVGLGNVDNTSDANKPVSTATQTALDAKASNTALANHEADTTNIHGIADTSVLATATTVATAKSEAITAAGTAADTKVSTAVAALTKSSVGLANVDNTSDANKPVSTATQTALNLKAPLASPSLTGTPTAPTANVGTNTTQVATTAFVKAAIEDIASLSLVLDGGGV